MDIPLLFITFARPEYARKTFDGIKKAKPTKLYFYSNKARADKPDEIERNETIRAYINEIDWDCSLKTFFREDYADIYTSLWSAIDWVFENEEQAIILEEDCVPSLAFFSFCEQLLPKYKDDLRVWVISGNNFIEGYNPNDYDYFYSPFAFQYGWASWKDRWEKVNRNGFNINDIIEYDLYRQIYASKKGAKHAYKWLKKNGKDGVFKTPAWDYCFQMTMRINGGFGVIPRRNLVSNIGEIGHHNTRERKGIHNRKILDDERYKIIKRPPFIVNDIHFTHQFLKKVTLRKSTILERVMKKTHNFLRKIR